MNSIADHAIVTHNIAALERALAVLDKLPAEAFARKSDAVFSASAGEHFRHIIEHYQLFLDGWPDGWVDYDRRPRDAQAEADPVRARASIEQLRQRLHALPGDLDLAQPVAVRYGLDNGAGLGAGFSAQGSRPRSSATTSCLSRELLFLHGHCVHHFAFIVIILQQHGIAMDEELGVAPSTLAHRRSASRAGE